MRYLIVIDSDDELTVDDAAALADAPNPTGRVVQVTNQTNGIDLFVAAPPDQPADEPTDSATDSTTDSAAATSDDAATA